MSDMEHITEIHKLLGILQNVDVGLVVLDRDYKVTLWNAFMENHSGMASHKVCGNELFEMFPEIQRDWLEKKLKSVFMLNNRAFVTWQQRPCLFRFDSYRPITSVASHMFQNVNIFPLTSLNGEVNQVCLMIYDVTEVALDEQALRLANRELERVSRTDGLTGLFNRSAWEDLLSVEYQRSKRSGTSAVLAMFDIDHFKKVNDTYGHQAGDDVIRAVSDLLREVKRAPDIAGRYGGEEFGVVLTDTDIEGASYFAERLRKKIENFPVQYGDDSIRFTISIGLAEFRDFSGGYLEWLEHSDKALYMSKESGRNQTSIAVL